MLQFLWCWFLFWLAYYSNVCLSVRLCVCPVVTFAWCHLPAFFIVMFCRWHMHSFECRHSAMYTCIYHVFRASGKIYRCHKQINDILIAPVTISIGWTIAVIRNHEFFFPTKFHENSWSCSWEKVETVNCWRTDDGCWWSQWCTKRYRYFFKQAYIFMLHRKQTTRV